MLDLATVAALLAAAVCVATAIARSAGSGAGSRRAAKYPRESAQRQSRSATTATAFLLAGLAFLALGGGIAAVDEKVRDPSSDGRDDEPIATGGPPSWPLSELDAFEQDPSVHSGPIERPLCLVRYYARRPGRDPGATWWTTCAENRSLDTVAEVRARLALPRAWGRRDARILATVPAGTSVTYVYGRAAPQCEPNEQDCYDGGGLQLLFRDADFARSWFDRTECSSGAEKAPIRFVPCAG